MTDNFGRKATNTNLPFPGQGADAKIPLMRRHQGDNGIYRAYRYLEVLTFTPGPMVETTVQERIY